MNALGLTCQQLTFTEPSARLGMVTFSALLLTELEAYWTAPCLITCVCEGLC